MDDHEPTTGGPLPEPNEFGLVDAGDGRYLHLPHTPHIRITTGDGDERVYVDAHTFMDVQKERDDLKRALALINGWRTRPGWLDDPNVLHRILESVGMDRGVGRAVDSILRQVAAETDAAAS